VILAIDARAQDEIGGVIHAGETFVADQDVIWRTTDAFDKIARALASVESLKEKNEALAVAADSWKKAYDASVKEIDELRSMLRIAEQEREALDRIADRNYEAFEKTDELLVKERKKNAPLFSSGFFLGACVGGQSFDFDELGLCAGYGLTVHPGGKK